MQLYQTRPTIEIPRYEIRSPLVAKGDFQSLKVIDDFAISAHKLSIRDILMALRFSYGAISLSGIKNQNLKSDPRISDYRVSSSNISVLVKDTETSNYPIHSEAEKVDSFLEFLGTGDSEGVNFSFYGSSDIDDSIFVSPQSPTYLMEVDELTIKRNAPEPDFDSYWEL